MPKIRPSALYIRTNSEEEIAIRRAEGEHDRCRFVMLATVLGSPMTAGIPIFMCDIKIEGGMCPFPHKYCPVKEQEEIGIC